MYKCTQNLITAPLKSLTHQSAFLMKAYIHIHIHIYIYIYKNMHRVSENAVKQYTEVCLRFCILKCSLCLHCRGGPHFWGEIKIEQN